MNGHSINTQHVTLLTLQFACILSYSNKIDGIYFSRLTKTKPK